MKLMRVIKKVFRKTTNLLAASLAVAFLAGPASICVCDDDPDHCGEACHDCSGSSADECEIVTIDVDDFTLSQNDDLPDLEHQSDGFVDLHAWPDRRIRRITLPASTSPPIRNWAYSSCYPRLNPIS